MTSGKSSDTIKTKESLQKVLREGISVIIITVGEPFEVTDISEPNLLTQLVWTDYNDDAYHGDEEVHEIICKVPVVIKPRGSIKRRKLSASQQFNCLLDTTNEFTLLEMTFGSLGRFFTSDKQGLFPSAAFFNKNTYIQSYGVKVEEFPKIKTVDMVPCSFKSFDLNETATLELLINSVPGTTHTVL
ncbi:hypothetical protein HELRODRAFT_172543 [Helobdella robusta]|uniref:Uncharacterized protein n=1 Tax=Helobdella robusta TaxID=6412 RepID=T1F5H5_HELRO|nr:hypothetical protein HELRODRAFT_172543 [Helobdella robusta]ESO04195.1 hypothetical protein HELRODRAFT_172543 [Helobdella robusta]